MPLEEGTLPIEDRSLLFGEGIYEVIAAYDLVPVLLQEHLERWIRSAEGLRLECPYSIEQQMEVIQQLLENVGAKRASIYGQLTRGSAKRAHPFPQKSEPSEFWFVRALPEYDSRMYSEGVAVITQPDDRWSRCWIKSTSLLPNVLAKQAATDEGAFESILYKPDGTVTEASVANFHVVKDGVIYTHPNDGAILGGCKRKFVLDIARENGIEVREEKYNLDFLRKVDEAFLTSTTINALPVTKLEGKAIGSGKVGEVLTTLMSKIDERIKELVSRNGVAS